MKRTLTRLADHILICCVVLLASCTIYPYTSQPRPQSTPSHVLSFDIQFGEDKWLDEIGLRYADAVAVFVHGNTHAETGEWYAYPSVGIAVPMEELVEELRETYPDDRIVLLVCNPDGLELDSPGVTYAKANVWVIPDRFVHPLLQPFRKPGNVGSVFDMEHNEWEPELALKGWEVVERKHANMTSEWGWVPPWVKPHQIENDTRPRKDKTITRRARRRAKQLIQKEIRDELSR